jgi:phosphoribosyl-AMP cyclohydrolase
MAIQNSPFSREKGFLFIQKSKNHLEGGKMIIETCCIQPDFAKGGGLVPVVVQDYNLGHGGSVLMLGYSNAEAFRLTIETGVAHFWSRSRQQLWKKGETSGNLLLVKRVFLDCDQDTLLYLVVPGGPVCHTGNRDCFFQEVSLNF